MSEKYDEVVVEILEELDRGNSASLSSYAADKELKSTDTLKRHFKNVINRYFIEDIKFDKSSNLWVAKRKDFLSENAMTANEAVVLSGIFNLAHHFGDNLRTTVLNVVNRYRRRSQLIKYQSKTVEDVGPFKKNIALYEKAKKNLMYIKLHYFKDGDDKERVVLPINIVNIEYYWYLIAETEDTKEIRHYSLDRINAIDLTNKFFYENELKKLARKVKPTIRGMNAYYEPYGVYNKTVTLYVKKRFMDYIKRAPYFSIWDDQGSLVTLDDCQEYGTYKLPATNEEFKDIIPTILKHMPDIVVPDLVENQDLLKQIKSIFQTYGQLHSFDIK